MNRYEFSFLLISTVDWQVLHGTVCALKNCEMKVRKSCLKSKVTFVLKSIINSFLDFISHILLVQILLFSTLQKSVISLLNNQLGVVVQSYYFIVR